MNDAGIQDFRETWDENGFPRTPSYAKASGQLTLWRACYKTCTSFPEDTEHWRQCMRPCLGSPCKSMEWGIVSGAAGMLFMLLVLFLIARVAKKRANR